MSLGFTPEPPDLVEPADPLPPGAISDGAFVEQCCVDGGVTAGINARNVAFHNVRIAGNTLAGAKLPGVGLTDCVARSADLSASTWTDARLVRVTFEGCKLTGFDACGADMRDVVFRDCKAPECLLIESTLTRVVFENCRVNDLDLSGSRIESVRIRGCDVRNLRLTRARIGSLDLRGCDIDGMIVEPGQLGGIVVETAQCPAIAAAMGVRVIDEM